MKKPIIGSIEHVQISLHGDDFVLAKVDTGADSSSIWASNIKQDDGRLSYSFFGPGSAYYSGATHTTKRYKVVNIKNSFGHTEVRFKVLLKLTIGDHQVKGWFSLADRSRNHYPILLGKSLIKDSFLVDVSKNHVHNTDALTRNVLVVSAGEKTRPFLEEVEKHVDSTIKFELSHFENMLFDIATDTPEVTDVLSGTELSLYDLTYVKSHWQYPEPASALAEYLCFKNKVIVDKELHEYTSRSKLSEMMKLAAHGIPVPRSLVAFRDTLLAQEEKVVETFGFPFILKNTAADKGKENYFIDTSQTYQTLLAKAQPTDIYAAQEFIPNDGFYRVNIFGGEAAMAVFRAAHPHKDQTKRHLNKPHGGANAELVDVSSLPSEMIEISVRAAMCMGRQVAGADMIQHKETGEWYVLEVNNSPEIRTGAYPEEKMKQFAKFIEERLEK